jgi:hypothetical protein
MSLSKNSTEEVLVMKTKTLLKLFMTIAILLLAIPVTTSAQIYQRDYSRYDRDDRVDRRDVRQAINQLDSSSARLESNLNAGSSNRRILGGLFWVRTESAGVAEVRNFRQAVAELRRSMRGDFSLDNSRDQARTVINRGIQLDRYLRLRTGSASVDAELANIRSSLHLLAEAYDLDLNRRY